MNAKEIVKVSVRTGFLSGPITTDASYFLFIDNIEDAVDRGIANFAEISFCSIVIMLAAEAVADGYEKTVSRVNRPDSTQKTEYIDERTEESN